MPKAEHLDALLKPGVSPCEVDDTNDVESGNPSIDAIFRADLRVCINLPPDCLALECPSATDASSLALRSVTVLDFQCWNLRSLVVLGLQDREPVTEQIGELKALPTSEAVSVLPELDEGEGISLLSNTVWMLSCFDTSCLPSTVFGCGWIWGSGLFSSLKVTRRMEDSPLSVSPLPCFFKILSFL